jgi:hypothetical protein
VFQAKSLLKGTLQTPENINIAMPILGSIRAWLFRDLLLPLQVSPPVDRRAEQANSVQGVLLVSCYHHAAKGLAFILDIPVLT